MKFFKIKLKNREDNFLDISDSCLLIIYDWNMLRGILLCLSILEDGERRYLSFLE